MDGVKEKGALISGSEPEKNDLTRNVDIEISTYTSQVLKVNDEETIMVLGGEGKFEQTREITMVLGGEEEKEQAMEKMNDEGNIEEETKDEGNIEEETKDEENLEVTKKKVSKLRKMGKRKKIALRGIDKVVAKNTDKVESSHKKTKSSRKNTDKVESSHKKIMRKVEGMGMIFMCSSQTKNDCYYYKVLGLPASKRDIVLKIYEGMRLFLFDYDLKLLYGIYKAAGPGGYNIEPKAFKSAFPSQVRFTVVEDCLPLAEEKFKRVIKDNYYRKNKFNCQLTSNQVKNLCKLFRVAGKGPKSKQFHRSPRAETHTFVDRNRPRWQDQEQDRRPAFVQDRLYLENPVAYERERFASPVAPLALRLLLGLPTPPAPALPLSYGYERNLATEVYRRDPFLEHREPRPLDLELRHQNEIEHHDSYILYRERPLYYDPLYSSSRLPEYHTPAGPPPEYHPSASLTSEYRPLRPLYRY